MKKFYAGIALAGMIAALAITGCPGPNNPVYSISLDTTGTYTFAGANLGYEAQAARTVTVTNTGNQATGALTIGKSGANAGSFTVSKAGIASIGAGASDTFTVAPNTGLTAGTYAAVITVGGGNGISESFNLSFTVSDPGTPVYAITLSETGTYAFPGAYSGYGAQTARTVTVTNAGNQATGALTIGKSGTNAADFTVSATGIADIAVAGSDTFTVAPNTGLAAGTHTATITVSGGNGIAASFNLSFTVIAPVYSVSLSETGTHTFPGVYTGYGEQTPITVTLNNTGNQPAGALTIGKSGTNAAGFTVSKASIADIAAGGSDTFTVAPNTGLAAGTYTATITVSGGHDITASFNLSFTVSVRPNFGIELNPAGTYTFPNGVTGYGTPPVKDVTITNIGLQATGALTIEKSGTNAADFTVSLASIPSIAATDGTASFTVAPVTGLTTGGPYTATITVRGGNDLSESFTLSFTVDDPVYDISLSETGTYTFPGAAPGYGTPAAETITVTNTGNQATGPLTITKSGANAASFTAPAGIGDIAAGGTGSFTVAPVTGLPAGIYTAAITVSGGHGISESFNLSFTVTSNLLTVTFDADGGTPAAATAQTANGGTVSLPADPAKPGYSFRGWYTAVNGGGEEFTGATPVTADRRVYARWLSADANLSSLSVSDGWMDPVFAPYITIYTMTVPYTTASLTVSAAVADVGKASLVLPANPVNLNPGENTLRVRVTAEDGTTTREYRITVTRTPLSANSNLGSLSVSTGALSPAFSANTTAYTVLVPAVTGSITLSAAAADTGKATVDQSPSNPVTLSAASTDITLTVRAEDGTTREYTVRVNKTTAENAINVTIGIADEVIDLTRSTANDLSREAYDTLVLTAPEGYTGYTWYVDMYPGDYYPLSDRVIELDPNWYSYGYGTHSVLLNYVKDGIPYGCEVLFRVVR
jgi:uncharacterized repeat protein (TIGR02543 family)